MISFKNKNNSLKKTKNLPALDLHGVKVSDVYDLVDRFIHKHNQAGTPKVKIIPGKGTGAVKTEVLKYLKQGHYPHSFEEGPKGNKNEGVLIIHLD